MLHLHDTRNNIYVDGIIFIKCIGWWQNSDENKNKFFMAKLSFIIENLSIG